VTDTQSKESALGTNAEQNVVELYADGVRICVKGEGPWVSEQVRELLVRLSTSRQAEGKSDPLPPLATALGSRTFRAHGDVAAIVAYYLQTQEGRSSWRSGEILRELARVGYPQPGNITDALTHRKKQGFFTTEDRMWRLTERGTAWAKRELSERATEANEPHPSA
jgi:hypothetical protein